MSLNLLSIATQALRMIGVIDGQETPDADVGADILIRANTMKRGWFGMLIGPRLSPFQVSGATAQAETGGEYLVGGTSAMTLSAPANPRPGARFGVVDAGAGFASHNCTLAGNGVLIGGAASVTLSSDGAMARYWFRPDVASWTLEADWASLNAALEFPDVLIAHMPAMLAVEAAAEFGQDIAPEIALAALEGRQALARAYGRRGPFGLDPVMGLGAPQAAGPGR
ncbi:MAG TPA: hypothetical protein VG248_02760 [Caulobacteraceae bacterium]|jgi:hypothetical protein|nr:hypothetical protein [Caulobacteraceae bacterium]